MPTNTPDVEQAEKRHNRSHRKLVVFLVCVIISTLMWLFIELMKDYSDEVKYTLRFENVPKDLILTNSGDSTIIVGLNAQGFELLSAKYLHKNKILTIDLSKIRIRQMGDSYAAFLSTDKLADELKKQIRISKIITSIKPDTLFFTFSEVYRKQIPVVLDFKYTLNSQYDLVDSIEFSPRMVTVSSIKPIIDTIRFVKTRPLKLNNIDTNLTVKLPLYKGINSNLIRYSNDTVTMKFKVNQVTEAVYNVPVSIVGEGKSLKIFPDKVQVFCRVPLNEYGSIQASSFIAEVSYTETSDKKLKVELLRIPGKVKVLKIEPASLDYILISK